MDRPQVSFFRVFNAEQVQDFPGFSRNECPEPEIDTVIDRIIDTSECPIHEIAQDRSFYSPSLDEIYLPLRSQFKDQTSFAKTLLHELAHMTGAASRLNRKFGGPFGSEGYAK
ncbi:zincin-like metallopeptidase domain-containing protein, partial [Porcincola intestinalis]